MPVYTPLPLYQAYIAKSRYARFRDDLNRREHFPETVERYLTFMQEHLLEKHNHTIPNLDELREYMLNLDIVPSMRAYLTAGEAAKRDNTCIFNCAYTPINSFGAFAETVFVLSCGTGMGFSVERAEVEQLPEIPDTLDTNIHLDGMLFHGKKPSEIYEEFPEYRPLFSVITVEDSKEGWADAVKASFEVLMGGKIPHLDTHKVRPAGSRLRTFGGRASGPGVLVDLIDFISLTVLNARGRKLTPLECHDIMCKIAEVVIVGSSRRSALISLSDLDDPDMRECKSGNWYENFLYRSGANNSAVYNEKPSLGVFMNEWASLYNSFSGERGIFNREAALKQFARHGRRKARGRIGTNPCAEIFLEPKQFCNLTSATARPADSIQTLAKKVRLATQLGTYQSTMTHFPYLSKEWTENTEADRLLGVSFAGIFDCPTLLNARPDQLEYLRDVAVLENKRFAEMLGIPQSKAVTCIKPEGNSAELRGAGSGLHGRWSPYYIRRVRAAVSDPLTAFMIAKGVPFEFEIGKEDKSVVFDFPTKAPEGSVMRDSVNAIQHLELWLKFKRHWCEHNPSVTIYVKEHEWFEVGGWVYEHFDEICGVSFLPFDGGVYKQAPYQEITKEEYDRLMENFPQEIDFDELVEYDDNVEGSQTLACTGGQCEI